MGQINEDFARRMLESSANGVHTSLTCWEEHQLARAWLKLNGHELPATDQWDPARLHLPESRGKS